MNDSDHHDESAPELFAVGIPDSVQAGCTADRGPLSEKLLAERQPMVPTAHPNAKASEIRLW